jgi:hypothetical protein
MVVEKSVEVVLPESQTAAIAELHTRNATSPRPFPQCFRMHAEIVGRSRRSQPQK